MNRRLGTIAACAVLLPLIETGEAGAQTIEFIELADEERHLDGEGYSCFNFYVAVGSDGSLTSAVVTPPGKAPIPLSGPDASNEFEFQSSCFSSLSNLRTSYPTGGYDFEFNGGTGSGGSETTENHSEGPPAGLADVTSPLQRSSTTSSPTLSWSICSGCETADGMDVVLYDLTDGSEDYESFDETPGAGSISPTGLDANHAYVFGVSLFNRTFTQPSYEYYDEAYNTTLTVFTVPEPGATVMLLAGVSLLLVLSRRPGR